MEQGVNTEAWESTTTEALAGPALGSIRKFNVVALRARAAVDHGIAFNAHVPFLPVPDDGVGPHPGSALGCWQKRLEFLSPNAEGSNGRRRLLVWIWRSSPLLIVEVE